MIKEPGRDGMKWKLSLFGFFRLVGPDGRALQTKSDRLKVLISFLSGQPSYCATRRHLAEALFDPVDQSRLPNLAVQLTRATNSLSSHGDLTLLISTNDQVGLVEDNIEIDIAVFEDLIRRARTEIDPTAANRMWREALLIGDRRPMIDLEDPLLVPLKHRVAQEVLEGLAGLVRGTLGDEDTALVLSRLGEFELEHQTSLLGVERLMCVYAALAMKEELIQAFTAYEAHLDYECGERAPDGLATLFNSLLAGLDQPKQTPIGQCPARPSATFGRQDVLDGLRASLISVEGRRVTTLTGQSGIGKSHILQELFWLLSPCVAVGFFDLETMPTDVASKQLRERTCDVVMIDHAQSDHRGWLAQLVRTFPATKFVCASQIRLGFSDEQLVILGPLSQTDQTDSGGAAREMLASCIGAVTSAPGRLPDRPDDRLLIELAALCDGIPLALEIAGRMGGSTGLEATVKCLRRNLNGLRNDRRNSDRRSSLANAIESSYRSLGDQSRRLVALLSCTGLRCHVDHLLTATDSYLCDLEEAILLGLVVRDPVAPYVRVRHTTALFVSAIAAPDTLERYHSFCLSSQAWFEGQASLSPLDLGVADSLPVALQMTKTLVEDGSPEEAVALFASVRPWLGSVSLLPADLGSVEGVLATVESMEFAAYPLAVLTLAAAYFHAGEFSKMDAVVETAVGSAAFANLSADLRCQLCMQRGLAKRCLGDLTSAIDSYRSAVAMADTAISNATLVKCYYNLGTLLESQERLDEALEAQECASEHFSVDTDLRVESLVNTSIGRLHYRKGDLASAGVILEATLAHARERQDRRSMSEILQNLGSIYYERKMYLRAALSETLGCAMQLEFGYTPEYRILVKSSFVTISASLFELGEDELARSTRTMIDRLGDADLYAPDRAVFEEIAGKTYPNPVGMRLSLATEKEVREHLQKCCSSLQMRSEQESQNLDLIRLAAVS